MTLNYEFRLTRFCSCIAISYPEIWILKNDFQPTHYQWLLVIELLVYKGDYIR